MFKKGDRIIARASSDGLGVRAGTKGTVHGNNNGLLTVLWDGNPVYDAVYESRVERHDVRTPASSLPVVGRDPGWRSSLGHETPASESAHGATRSTGNMQTGPRGGKFIVGPNGKKYYPVKGRK